MIGQCFHIVAWSLISSLTAESHATVYLGFICIGLGADTAFLPTLLVTRLFPGAAATVLTLIGSASSASFAIPLILHSYLTDGGISGCWWYVGFGPCLFLVIVFFVMPLKAYKAYDEANFDQQVVPSDQKPASERPPMTTGQTRELSLDMGWITSFYQEAHDRILVQKAQDFLGSALPFSFIPCIILGKLSESIGIISVMGIVNTAGLLAYAFSLKQAAAAGMISVLCFMVYMSLFVSQVFVYIEENFPAVFFGRLIGIVQLVGGLLSLLCSPLFHLTVGLGPKGMYVVQLPMIGLLILVYFLLVRMWWIKRSLPDLQKRDCGVPEQLEP
ncbi:hypothetical protein cyc_06662 [Cyclospora cayetanensis]|uniref:Uncharacterized protein n=1 Tax=Cyclospora cayetanensis TaxID=88456 RepID=A0A1D3CRS9_9EIME|nr:hypothetical protein cyc_06662 [Cyclospora cayetanensis]